MPVLSKAVLITPGDYFDYSCFISLFFFAANLTPLLCAIAWQFTILLSFSGSARIEMMINNDAKEDNGKSCSGDLGKAVNHAYSLSKMKEKGRARLGVFWWTGKSLSEIDISEKASLTSSASPSIKGKKTWEDKLHSNLSPGSWIYRNV